jgi:FlaA1/EpsC-like NDP-sugar epimerase
MKVRLRSIFKNYRPDLVFHAAAYKHVPLMEDNPSEAVLLNVLGSKNVADLCLEYGVEKMVMISSDKAVNPTNVMGASKRIAEIYVQSLGVAIERGVVIGNTKFITTRFGNVLGSNGSVVPLFQEQIAKGGPITVTHPDITRYFMTIPEACKLVMKAASMGEGNEIFVFDMGKPVKIVELANKMIELSGLVPNKDVKISYIGLRPGEKLYEELLSDKESTIPTTHEKILIAKVRECDYGDMSVKIRKLIRLAFLSENEETIVMMKQIVPEYRSAESK